jgi:hypothetical protein
MSFGNKKLIYMVAIDHESSRIKNSDYAQWSIASWELYCKKYGFDFVVVRECQFTRPIWHKSMIYKDGQGYDFIGIVDSDTIVSPNAPDVSVNKSGGFYAVYDLCDLNWVMQSIKDRQRFFPNVELDLMQYFNAGVMFFTKEYLDLFEDFLQFVMQNESEIEKIQGGGKEQTLLNFFVQQRNIKVNFLQPEWNLMSIHKKNMFTHNWQLNVDQTPHFIKYAHVWHFTGFPIEQRAEIMEKTFKFVYPS